MSDFPAYQSAPQSQGIYPSHVPSLRGRSIVAIIAVVIATLATCVAAVAPLFAPGAQVVEVSTGVSLALYLGAGIAFVVWLYRARANLESFGVYDLNWARGWAIGAWFVPLANLVLPILVIGEIDKATAARRAETTQDTWGGRDSGRPIFILWAVFWTLRSVGSYAPIVLQDFSPAAGAGVKGLIEIGAGLCAVLLILRITNNQETLRDAEPARLANAGPAAPVPAAAAWPDANL
jgi:hypothetical protein